MVRGRSLGPRFRWLWSAYAVSAFGTWLGFGAFPLLAILVLHAGPLAVSALAAVGPAVGALVAVPLGPWVDRRRKRPVMVGMDLVRFASLVSVPAAYALGLLSFAQLLVVSVIVAAADITFTSASGAFLKGLVPPEDLLLANGRFESTNWTATALGPPLGGAAFAVLGPVTSVVANAVSFLLSALGIRAIKGDEPHPRVTAPLRARDLADGWRFLLTHPGLRPLFCNVLLFNGLIMGTEPLLAVLMLKDLGFAPWQYGLAFAVPCLGGLAGSRLTPRLVERFGRHPVLVTAGAARACWLLALAFLPDGAGGLAYVMVVELGLIVCCSVFNPVLATYRLEQLPADRVARTLSAWSVSTKAAIATMTALWGVLAGFTGSRVAIGIAGVLVLATPFLLPRRDRTPAQPSQTVPSTG
ncbi:MFS transporter [Amycolatopsis vancoresmycina]|uniref:MFS multidrug efflux protein n=1 Tax=Amycolatopsis vancoresmycina DSM 44592 TaxID=1292037 RepID=R1HXB3_9PSEU|nr:MFS transporter [Amycolatopsis vancoresmycina]EOD68195.1 MFS multidrug efflux protein [Amycolatopsis vancoresmycina DSM 44592]